MQAVWLTLAGVLCVWAPGVQAGSLSDQHARVTVGGKLYAYVNLSAEWSVEIDVANRVATTESGSACELTPQQLDGVERVLSSLPSDRAKYVYGGPVPTDVYPLFKLEVRRAGKAREYSYWKLDHSHPDDRAIGRVQRAWRFLHGLCRVSEGK